MEEKFKINQATLRLFKQYLYNTSESVSKMILVEEGLKYGILLDDKVSDTIFNEIVRLYGIDGFILNQTFHKSLEKVAKEELITLYIEQIVHYFTTYGYESLGITDGSVYIPNEKLEVPILEEGCKLTYISHITEEELKKKVTDLVMSGIALSKQSIKDIITLSDYIEGNIEDIKNKEIRTILYSKYDIVPKNNIEFLRFLIFKLTGSSLLIKDDSTINKLKGADKKEILKYLNQYINKYGLIPLSEIFNRYKPLFLALKRDPKSETFSWGARSENERKTESDLSKSINKIINTISKISKTHHKPAEIDDELTNFRNTVKRLERFPEQISRLELRDILDKNSLYKIIRTGNYVNYSNYQHTEIPVHVYKIRNKKVFIKEDMGMLIGDSWINNEFRDNIIRRVSNNVKDKVVYIPDNINYSLPQSEKQFVGNIPFNSSVDFDKNRGFLVGIHWTNIKDGNRESRVDLDLKLLSNKYQIGWNCYYRNENDKLLFTGDVTDAPISKGGACEYIYVSGDLENTVMTFKINNYTTEVGPVPFEIILAYAPTKTKVLESGRNYIVDPKDIICKVPCEIEKGQSEHNIGILNISTDKNSFIFTDLSTGNLPVSKNNIFDDMFRNYLVEYCNLQYDLKDILKSSGAIISKTPFKEELVEYVLIQDGKATNMIKKEELSENCGIILEKGIFKKEKTPVDIDLSIEALNKSTILNIFKEE